MAPPLKGIPSGNLGTTPKPLTLESLKLKGKTMTDSNEVVNATEQTTKNVELTYHFKALPATEANAKKIAAIIEVDEDGNETNIQWPEHVAVSSIYKEGAEVDADGNMLDDDLVSYKRESETYTVAVPTAESLGVAGAEAIAFVQAGINKAFESFGRNLVNDKAPLTAENISWEMVLKDALSSGRSSGAKKTGIGKELLTAAVKSFQEYLRAIGKPEAGIEVMCKMMRGRFNAVSVVRYLQGLPLVRANLISWVEEGCTEEEQVVFAPVAIDMCGRIDAALEPKEEDTASLF